VTLYTYTPPIVSKSKNISFAEIDGQFRSVPKGALVVYDMHSHGAYNPGYDVNNFSPNTTEKGGLPSGDGGIQDHYGIGGFVATPSGVLLGLNKWSSNQYILCDCLTRDIKKYPDTPQANDIRYQQFIDLDNPRKRPSYNLAPVYFKGGILLKHK
jgi:hypothetical protein